LYLAQSKHNLYFTTRDDTTPVPGMHGGCYGVITYP